MPNENPGKTHHSQTTLGIIINFLLLAVVIIALLDGYSIQKIGFTRLETIYYILLIISLLIWYGASRTPLLWLIYLLVLPVCLILGIILTSSGIPRLVEDLRYFLRSYLLGITIFLYIRSTPFFWQNVRHFFSLQWFFVTFFVLIHYFLDFGGVTSKSGELRPSYSSFFKEGNVIAFFFVITWFFLYTNQLYSRKTKIALTVTSIGIASLLSSKAAILCIPLLVYFDWQTRFKLRSSYGLVFINIFTVLLSVICIIYINELMDSFISLLVNISPDTSVILYRIGNWDLLTVLTSTRDLRVIELFNDMRNYSLWKLLFGIGFHDVLRLEKLIESDPFDILQAFGIIGFLMFYFPAIATLWHLKSDREFQKKHFDYYVFALGTFYATIFASTATGHILLTPMAMILLGIIFGRFMYLKDSSNIARGIH